MSGEKTPRTRHELETRITERAWKDADFAAALADDPRQAIASAFGLAVPADLRIAVHDEGRDAGTWHLVIPPRPAAAEGELSEQDLAGIAGGVRLAYPTFSTRWLSRTVSLRGSVALDPGRGGRSVALDPGLGP